MFKCVVYFSSSVTVYHLAIPPKKPSWATTTIPNCFNQITRCRRTRSLAVAGDWSLGPLLPPPPPPPPPNVSTLSANTSGEIQTQIIHYIGKLTFFVGGGGDGGSTGLN